MRKTIAETLADVQGKPNCSDFVSYLDEIKNWGRQYVFLFSISNDKKTLSRLSSADYIKKCLKEAKLEDRYNKNICFWEVPEPTLAEVKHIPKKRNVRGQLSFKWIETFRFNRVRKGAFQTFFVRTTNFFIVNLEDHSAQLRIEQPHSRSKRLLKQRFDFYIKEVNRLLGASIFSLISLDPIIKRFLRKTNLQIERWEIIFGGGKVDGGPTKPSKIQKLLLFFKHFTALEVRLSWACDQIAQGREQLSFTLDHDTNSIAFEAVTDDTRVDFIIYKLLHAKKIGLDFDGIKIQELIELARNHPKECAIISLIDYLMRAKKERKFHSGNFATQTGFDEVRLKKLFYLAASGYPDMFSAEAAGDHAVLLVKGHLQSIKTQEIMQYVKKYPGDYLISDAIDHAITNKKVRGVNSWELAAETEFEHESVETVFHKIAGEIPEYFVTDRDGDCIILLVKEFFGNIYNDQLQKLAKRYPSEKKLIAFIDYSFNKSKKIKLHSALLAKETGYDEDRIKRVFQLVAEEFPMRFNTDNENKHTILEKWNLLQHGLIDLFLGRLGSRLAKKLLKPVIATSWIPVSTITYLILDRIIEELLEAGISIFGMPVFLIKILITVIVLIVNYLVYGNKKIKKIVSSPLGHVDNIPRSIEKIKSGITINEKEYDKWVIQNSM